MICLSENEQGAELLTGYLARTLDAAGMAELSRHFQECPDCRGLVTVWERLDEFAAPEVTRGFDARLYARIAAEETRRPWWYRLLWPPVAPVAIAAVAAVVLYIQVPGHAPGTSGVFKQSSSSEIEQVAQAVDDLDLLIPIDK